MSAGTQNTLILKNIFDGVDPESLAAIRAVARKETYPVQTVLITQGAIEHTLYILLDGRVAVSQQLENGEERILGILGPGKSFGEMSLIDDSPRMASCTALTEVTVLEVDEAVFDTMMMSNPAVAYSMLRKILENSRSNDKTAIAELNEKNTTLQQAYNDLKAAQAIVIKQERLEIELELAATMQRSLLPLELPQLPDYKFAAYLQPARLVGGDFYDVDVLDEECVGLVLADVADKGFHAALFMAVSRTLFLQEGRHSLSPVKVALAVHQGMLAVSATDDIFVTAFYGVLHRPSGELTYVRAAQERPLLYRPGEGVKTLPGDGRFLGMFEQLELVETTVSLQPGDRVLIFSDGVPDMVDVNENRYGYARLHEVLGKNGRLPAKEIVAAIVADLDAWSKNADPFDDVTILVLEVCE